jgi:hypothetical protein
VPLSGGLPCRMAGCASRLNFGSGWFEPSFSVPSDTRELQFCSSSVPTGQLPLPRSRFVPSQLTAL